MSVCVCVLIDLGNSDPEPGFSPLTLDNIGQTCNFAVNYPDACRAQTHTYSLIRRTHYRKHTKERGCLYRRRPSAFARKPTYPSPKATATPHRRVSLIWPLCEHAHVVFPGTRTSFALYYSKNHSFHTHTQFAAVGSCRCTNANDADT